MRGKDKFSFWKKRLICSVSFYFSHYFISIWYILCSDAMSWYFQNISTGDNLFFYWADTRWATCSGSFKVLNLWFLILGDTRLKIWAMKMFLKGREIGKGDSFFVSGGLGVVNKWKFVCVLHCLKNLQPRLECVLI